MTSRSIRILAALSLALLWGAAAGRAAQEKTALRIAYFRPSIPATVQKFRGTLEERLAPLGVTVEWKEFKVPADSLLALAAGDIDLTVSGVEGSISAISKGIPMQIVATGPHGASKTGWYTAILVPENSPIKTLADLKGRKIAVGKGGYSEAILSLAIRQGGLKYPEDVQPVYLTSSDGVNAFKAGHVEAIVAMDPYAPFIQRDTRAGILTDNEKLGYPTVWGMAVSTAFAAKHPEALQATADEFLKTAAWVGDHRAEAAAHLAKEVGFDQGLWEITLGRASYRLEAVSPKTLPDIQYVADQLLELGVIRKPVRVQDSIWTPAKP